MFCEGEHEVGERVFGVELGLGFQPQRCQHFRSLLLGLCRAAAHRGIGRTGFTLGTGAGVAPRAKTIPTLQHMEPANMTPSLGGG